MIRNLGGRRGLFLIGGILLVGVILMTVGGFWGGTATPAPPLVEKDPVPVPALNDWGTLGDMAVKLALVVALVYATVWFLRRYVGAAGGRSSGRKSSLQVLESQYLAPQRAIHLIAVGGKVLVVGSTPTQISFLSEITEPDQVESLRTALVTAPDDPFGRYLNAAIRGPLSSRMGLVAETTVPPPWLSAAITPLLRWLRGRFSPQTEAKDLNC